MVSKETILKFNRNRKIAKTCPCGRNNQDGKFSPFLGYNEKGHCFSCGQSFFPDDYVRSKFVLAQATQRTHDIPISFLPFDVFERSVMAHENCDLFPYLERLFRKPLAKWLCEKYFIGTNRDGLTAFWQVDEISRIRQCKVIHYSSEGMRSQTVPPYFVGKKILGDENALLAQTFFGGHLLNDNIDQTVAIVESEKTSVIASVYFPQYVWIATGGKHGCSLTQKSVVSILQGRKVVLFPDLNAYQVWYDKAKLLEAVAGCKVVVSNFLEKHASDKQKKQGLDIADFLLVKIDETGLALTDNYYPVIWDYKY